MNLVSYWRLHQWDVTSLVTSNGNYSFSIINGSVSNFAGGLVVIYSHASLPLTEVRINEACGHLNFGGGSLTSTFNQVSQGAGRLLLLTGADEDISYQGAQGGSQNSDETITFNTTQIGGPLDGNLGILGSAFDIPVKTVEGTNSAGITATNDWMGWHLAILVSRPQPRVTFSAPSLIDGKVRLCAGAIVDDVHTATVPIEAKISGESSANTSLTFSFDTSGIDYTHCKLPKFIDDDGNQVATLTRTTNAEGKTSIKVLSSDLVSQPKIVAKWTNAQNKEVDVGEVTCDFVAEQSLRRFGIKSLNQGYDLDEGWDLNTLSLQYEGDTTDATIYLKYQKDPTKDVDTNYFLIGGAARASQDTGDGQGGAPDGFVDNDEAAVATIRGRSPHVPLQQRVPLDDDTNWLPVGGHHLRVRIAEIMDDNYSPVSLSDFHNYVVIVGDSAQGTGVVNVTTDSEGRATVHLTAGPWIKNCSSIRLEAIDNDQRSPSGVDDSTGWGN